MERMRTARRETELLRFDNRACIASVLAPCASVHFRECAKTHPRGDSPSTTIISAMRAYIDIAGISLITAGKPCGRSCPRIRKPSASIAKRIIHILNRGEGGKGQWSRRRGFFCRTRIFVRNAHRTQRVRETEERWERERETNDTANDWENEKGRGERESRTTNGQLYGRTLIRSLIEISIWGSTHLAQRYLVHNSPWEISSDWSAVMHDKRWKGFFSLSFYIFKLLST